jgi:GNAT superfamily N-acetyltransferase
MERTRSKQQEYPTALKEEIGLQPALENRVATGALLYNPEISPQTGYLSLLQCVNDLETFERLIDELANTAAEWGVRRISGPTGLSAQIENGVLVDSWDQQAPSFTPANSPYLPEMMQGNLNPAGSSRLYRLDIRLEDVSGTKFAGDVQIEPLDAGRLAGDLLPLMAAAGDPRVPPVDMEEAEFLLRWTDLPTRTGWTASLSKRAAGFVLVQDDHAPALNSTKGGKSPLAQALLFVRMRRPAVSGRVLFGSVLPKFRNQGAGSKLLQQAVSYGRERGWKYLTIGPVPVGTPTEKFLIKRGAIPRQSYQMYQRDL